MLGNESFKEMHGKKQQANVRQTAAEAFSFGFKLQCNYTNYRLYELTARCVNA